MGTMLLAAGTFLAEHYDLLEQLMQAIQGGLTKVEIMQMIKQRQIDAANVAVAADLGPRPGTS